MTKKLLSISLFAALLLPIQIKGQVFSMPYSYGFEDASLSVGGWSTVDLNNDGYSWSIETLINTALQVTSHEGSQFVSSFSYIAGGPGNLTPNNLLISPAIAISDTASISWWHHAAHASWNAEHYSVYVVPANATTETLLATSPVYDTTLDAAATLWQQQTVQLNQFIGDTVRIAFRHYGCTGQWSVAIDDVSVSFVHDTPAVDTIGVGDDSCLRSLPYVENFEENHTFPYYQPDCWRIYGDHCYIDGNTGYNSTYSLCVPGSPDMPMMLLTPPFDAPANRLKVSFSTVLLNYTHLSASDTADVLHVGILTEHPGTTSSIQYFLEIRPYDSVDNWMHYTFTTDTLTDTTHACLVFQWSGNPTDYNPRTLRLDAIEVLDLADTMPLFDTVWRTVIVDCDSTMGTVSGGGVCQDSSNVLLTATPLDGYVFDHWDDGDTLNPRQVFVVSDTAFTALFRVAEDTVGIPENADKEVRLSVYPNPSHGEVTIVVNQPATVSVTDLVGREIVPPTAVNDRLSMAGLSVGVYLVRVSTDSASSVKKLIVE